MWWPPVSTVYAMTDIETSFELGILGVGAIAEAIVTGLCEERDAAPSILLSPRSRPRSRARASRYPSVHVAEDNESVVSRSRVVLLSMRPQDAGAVLRDVAFSPGQAVISVIAGVPLARLRELAAPATVLARAVPLPAVARRQGLTAIHPPRQEAQSLFDRLGGTIAVEDEDALDALSASTATIAAHFAYLATVSRWLTARGIREADAARYVAATFAPLAETLSPSPADLMALADAHATAGGINEQFYASLRQAGVFEIVEHSLDRIADRLRQ
jgi:pyrroline-5-carboxylate reductase